MAMPPVPITHNGEGMNQAKWHATYESFANQAMAQGYTLAQIVSAVQAAGETWPKDLSSSITSKNTLFPGADMGYQYDLDNHTKQRPVSYSDPSLGMMDAVPMESSEIDAANKYYAWRENPANYGLIAQYADNPYNAYVAATHGSAIGVTPSGASVLPTSGGASSSSSGASTAKPVTDWYVQKPDGTIVTRASLGANFDLSGALSQGYKSLKNQSLYPNGNGTFSQTAPKASSSSGGVSSASGVNTTGQPVDANGNAVPNLAPLFNSLIQSSKIDQQNQLFQLDKAKQQYGAGVGQQNYLSDLYGQVLGVGFNRPNYAPTSVDGGGAGGNTDTGTFNNGGTSGNGGGPDYGGPSGFGVDPNNNYYSDQNGNLIPTSRRGQPGVPPPGKGDVGNGPGPGWDPNAPFNQDPNQGGNNTGGVFGDPSGPPTPGNGGYTIGPDGSILPPGNPNASSLSGMYSRGAITGGGMSGGVSSASGTTQPVVKFDPNATTSVPWSQNPANPYVSDPWWNGTLGVNGPPNGTTVAYPNGTNGTFNDGGGTYYIDANGNVVSGSNPNGGNQNPNPLTPPTPKAPTPGTTTNGAPAAQGSGYYQLGNSFNPNNPSTWALLGAPASQIAGDLDSQKKNIMMNLPAGGERDKALADAMNSSYGNLSGLRQGLVSQSLQGIGNISQSQISGTAVPNSGSAGTAASLGGSLLNNSLGLQQLTAQKQQSGNNMWGSILGAVAPVVLGAILSDVRTKEEVTPFTRGLSDLMKVEPYQYSYNGKAGSKKGQKGISVMAQDLKESIPEAVLTVPTEDFPDTHMILPMGLLMTAVNSIQELNLKVSKLERKKK